MRKGLGCSQLMLPMTTLLLKSNADLSFRDEKGESACTLLFQSGTGLQYIESTLYQMISLEVYEDFQSKDLWLMATIARTVPEFRQRLEAGLRDLRTPAQLSSCIRPRYEKILELDAARQTQWIEQAPVEDRVSFMKALCSYGTPKMLQPFIQSSINLDETDKNGIIYTRLAARMGNLKVLMALSQAGGSLEQKDWFWNPDNLCCSALEELLSRWICMQTGRGVPGKDDSSVDSELWILPWLLDQRGHESPNALYAIVAEDGETNPDILYRLLAHGFGRRDGQPPKTYLLNYRGSEVIEAVRSRNLYLKAFLDAGLALECEDWRGLTATLYAIDMGETEALKLLIRAGSNLERKCTYGITALELATSNLKAGHPRRRNRAMTGNYWDTADELLSFETDAEVYQILTQALQKDCTLPLCKCLSFRQKRWIR
jgi:ankyrin repeat protein